MVRRRGPPGLEAGLACLDRRLVVTSARGRDTVRVVHQDARVCSSFAKAQEVVYQRLSSLFFAPTTSARTLHGTRAGSPHARLSCPVPSRASREAHPARPMQRSPAAKRRSYRMTARSADGQVDATHQAPPTPGQAPRYATRVAPFAVCVSPGGRHYLSDSARN